MTGAQPRVRLLQGAALVAPALIILAVGTLAGGPAAAPAGPAAAAELDPALVPVLARPLTPEQERCMRWLASMGAVTPGSTPMVVETAAQPEPENAAVEQAPAEQGPQPQADQPAPPPSLRLTALLGSSTGGIAVIDGRICSPGQAVAPGWRLSRVEASDDWIEIACDDGRTERLRLRRDLPSP